MTMFDYTVLTILIVSVILGLMRGFAREVLSLAGWLVAFYVAKTYTQQLLPMMPADMPTESLRVLATFLVLFFATLLITTLLGIALSAIFKTIGLGWVNRLLGVVFGVIRGIVVVGIVVFLAGLTDIPKDVRWRNAMLSAPTEAFVVSMLPYLPSNIAQYVNYD